MEKEVSCVNTKVILDYIKKYNSSDCSVILENLDPEIDALDDPKTFLTDPNNWVSTCVIVKLFERIRNISKDDRIAIKIAKFAVENSALGYIQKIFVKAFWSSKKGFKNVQEINSKFNRNKKVELVEIKRNKAIVRLYWNSIMGPSKDLCLYNQGLYSFLPTIWLSKPVQLDEKCCYFEDAPYCEYHIKWQFQNKVREYFSRFFTSRAMLKDIIEEQEKDKDTIEKKYEEVNRLNVELNYKIKQLLAIHETGKAILSLLNLDQLLTSIISILSTVCKINRALIMLVNEEKKCLEYVHGVGFIGGTPVEVKNYRVPLHRVSNILVRVTNTGRPEYVPEVKSSRLRKDNIILSLGKPTSVYVVPLITRSKVIGVIATDATDGKGVQKQTRETLEIFAPQIAIAIENAKLYKRLQEQMLDLRKSHALLSRAEKFSFLGNLAARLAHEIKNPMTAIGTFIQMLPQKFDDEEFRNEFYEVAMEETNRVNNLITELLDLVKTKEPLYELGDLHDLIDKMVLLVSPQSNKKKIKVAHQFDPNIGQIWMDSEKMKQVILNILSNAVEFTPDGGKVNIATTNYAEKGKPKSIRIDIKDNGVGIPQPMIDKIFDPYFTTKHRSNMHNGTGLGLSIAHQNMGDHGGNIEVKSKVNEGTTFTLILPNDPSSLSSGKTFIEQ
jgi:signal transduction histidine kinase